jgi:hypothetical protein
MRSHTTSTGSYQHEITKGTELRFIGHFQDKSGRTRLQVSVEADSEPDARWATEQYAYELSRRERKREPYRVTDVYADLPRVEHREDGSVWARDLSLDNDELVRVG